MAFAEDQDVIQTVAPERSDQALSIGVLPGRPRRDRTIANPHAADSTCEGVPVGAVIVAHQIGRCRIPRECLHDLLRQPLRRRIPGYRKPQQLSPSVANHKKSDVGQTSANFTPTHVASRLPDPSTQLWPMGDVLSDEPLPLEIDATKLKQAIDAAFDPTASMTAAFVVTWRGRLIAERYGNGITAHTPLEGWSMGKSLTATLIGVLIKQGVYDIWQPAPIPEWQGAGDPRAKIRIGDIMHMSSGLRIRAPQDPDYDPAGPYPDHLYLYTGSVNSFHYAATRPLQWPPNTVGRYRNSDPVLINYLIRLAVEKRGEDYFSFPQRALFDKIGIRTMVMDTDPYGNFLTQGYELACGRDWARLGNLYLQDGMWNGERILPEGYAKFVSTLAPAWEADKRPIYGAFFWINGDGRFPLPKEAYYMSGAGGQWTLIIPSHDLVVVRLGHYRGAAPGERSFSAALALLMQAVPRRL
jgi:CubicO group peptidase (beta-lactamase class C family)